MDGEDRHGEKRDGYLGRRLGELLVRERTRAGLSQRALARSAGIPQQMISRFELGVVAPSTGTVERLFGALGRQVRIELEMPDAQLEQEIRRSPQRAEADRSRAANALSFLWQWGPWPPRMVIDGPLAALLRGLPIPVAIYDLLCAEGDVDHLADWILRLPNIERFSERAGGFNMYRLDPREPGPLYWRPTMCEFQIRLVPHLPESVTVRIDDHELPVRALTEVITDHLDVARALRSLAEPRSTR